MYPEALSYLRNPDLPQAHLELAPGARHLRDGEIVTGALRCAQSGQRFPIRHGIADLLGARRLPRNPAQFTNYLPLTAWGYERLWRTRALTLLAGEPFGYTRELPLITGLVEPQPGGLYLDVACSNGLYARAIAAHQNASSHVIGIDHAWPMLRQARAFARQQGQRISYVRASAQALPVAAGAAAGVTMGGSLNEIGDVAGSLHEMRRVLGQSGRVVLMHLTRARTWRGWALQTALQPGGVVFYRPGWLHQQMQASGLRRVAEWRYGVVLFTLLTAARYQPEQPVLPGALADH